MPVAVGILVVVTMGMSVDPTPVHGSRMLLGLISAAYAVMKSAMNVGVTTAPPLLKSPTS
jgi:hypothetical protein